MSDNNLTSALRRPVLKVYADGVLLTGVLEARVFSNNFFTPDRFSIRLLRGSSLNEQPDYLKLPATTSYEIRAALTPNDSLTSLLVGYGDSQIYDQLSRGIRIDGRDLSAGLQDTPSTDVFANLTSSEIVTRVALRHALIPVVTQTVSLAGRYYHDDTFQTSFSQFNRITTEWDLLVFLAKCENFDLFVMANQLFFQPAAPINSSTVLIQARDLITLRLKHRLRMSGDIAVTVRSWSSKTGTAISQRAISRPLDQTSAAAPVSASPPLHYNIMQPNLSIDNAAKLAESRVDEISRHEQSIECSMPGELDLTPRDSFTLEGTDSIYDQDYRIDTIDRIISTSAGFTQRLCAHSISGRQIIQSTGAQ